MIFIQSGKWPDGACPTARRDKRHSRAGDSQATWIGIGSLLAERQIRRAGILCPALLRSLFNVRRWTLGVERCFVLLFPPSSQLTTIHQSLLTFYSQTDYDYEHEREHEFFIQASPFLRHSSFVLRHFHSILILPAISSVPAGHAAYS